MKSAGGENQYPILIDRLPLLIDEPRPARLADVDPRPPRARSMESAISIASLRRMVRLRRVASRPSLRPASFAFCAMLRPALLRPTVTAVAASNPAAAVPNAILAGVLMPRCDLRRDPPPMPRLLTRFSVIEDRRRPRELVDPPLDRPLEPPRRPPREEEVRARPLLPARAALADPPRDPRSAMVMLVVDDDDELPREVRRRELLERVREPPRPVRELRDLVRVDPPEDRFALLAMAHLVLVDNPNNSTAKSRSERRPEPCDLSNHDTGRARCSPIGIWTQIFAGLASIALVQMTLVQIQHGGPPRATENG
jgi:hypothetical protein